ncbi:hypothetical protein ACWDG1_45900 [Streptomyces sp. NPDC001177]
MRKCGILAAVAAVPAVMFALDSTSETVTQEAIDRLVDGKTVVIVDHRLSTDVTDQILVRKDGRLAPRGTGTDALAHSDGRYAARTAVRRWQLPAGDSVEGIRP